MVRSMVREGDKWVPFDPRSCISEEQTEFPLSGQSVGESVGQSVDFTQSGQFDLTAYTGIMTRSRIAVLKALKPCPKSISGFCSQIGMKYKLAHHHLAALEKYGLVTKFKRKVFGIRGQRHDIVYKLSELGGIVLAAYDVSIKEEK